MCLFGHICHFTDLHTCTFACMPIYLSAYNPICLRFCLYACVPAGRHTGRRAYRCRDMQVCLYGNRQACRPFCLQSKGHFFNSVSFLVLVAACGSKWQGVASFSARFQMVKRPNFAPKRQGNAPDAHTAPRLRPSFGQPKGIGRPIPYGGGNRQVYPQSVVYGFLCPQRHSKVSFE